jgi:hypothetical protein
VVVQVKVELVTDVVMVEEEVVPQLRIIQQAQTVVMVEFPVVVEVAAVQELQQVVEEEVVMVVEERLGFILGKYLFLWA